MYTLRSSEFMLADRSVFYRFFQKIEDYTSALQFLVLSNCNSEAYTMAEVRDEML